MHFLAFVALAGILSAATYTVGGLEAIQPWRRGEPLPLLRFVDSAASEVRLDAYGELSVVPEDEGDESGAGPSDVLLGLAEPVVGNGARPAPMATGSRLAVDTRADDSSLRPGALGATPPIPVGSGASASRAASGFLSPELAALPVRPPAVPTPLQQPAGALDSWYQALASAEDGEPGRLVRVVHFGDSTIAADGITGQVRRRLQDRFGDGGPGFLAIEVDPRWGMRPGILRTQSGDWDTKTITFGGSDLNRYGLAGTVSTAEGEATVRLAGLKQGTQRQLLHRFDVYYRRGPGLGTLSVHASGAASAQINTHASQPSDDYRLVEAAEGARFLSIRTSGDAPVVLYGVALETRGPGVTWESLGVAGSSIASVLTYQDRSHIRGQVRRRAADLVVYQTGGNELTYPLLHKGEGEGYEKSYRRALQRLRSGAAQDACLVIGPLDQATRERGKVVSKEPLDRMIAIQRRVSMDEGCAFWDARNAMGGEGGFARWLHHDPPFAWTDLMHLTMPGLDLVGDCLADALLSGYEVWRQAHPDAGWRPEPGLSDPETMAPEALLRPTGAVDPESAPPATRSPGE